METPDVQYARSGDVAIAYQVVGSGPLDVVFVRGTIADLLAGWDQPLFVAHVEGLTQLGRVLLFDKRGSGLSDPVRQVPTLETRMDDIRAVMDAAGSERAVVWAGQEGSRIGLLFAATYPERTSALVLYDPTARGLWAPDYPWAPDEETWRRELREVHARWGDRSYLSARVRRFSPSRADDEEFVDWFAWYMRPRREPGGSLAVQRMSMEGDVREVLSAVRSPTLVLHRPRARDASRSRASGTGSAGPIPSGTNACSKRRGGSSKACPRRRRPIACSRRSCSRTSSARRARRPSSATAAGVSCSTGTTRSSAASSPAFAERSSTPAATASSRAFDGPGRAIECALAIRAPSARWASRSAPGRHTGECERVDGKLGGIVVPTGARIAALADAGEVLVSQTVKDLVAGSELRFGERGDHELKGVPGTWRLYAVAR